MATALEKLEAEPVLATARRLRERICARFPGRGLHAVASELLTLTEEVATVSATGRGRMRNVRVVSRAAIVAVLVITALAVAFAVRGATSGAEAEGLEWLAWLESGVNDVVFAAIAVWFLYSMPERLRRSTTLDLLHRLRSLAHIIDMHQLTKDPERLRSSFTRTAKSPEMNLTPEELEYYLDYCSELLSLVGKAAGLCAEESRDTLVLETVSTIETLTVSLERKIWQKISVLNQARRELEG